VGRTRAPIAVRWKASTRGNKNGSANFDHEQIKRAFLLNSIAVVAAMYALRLRQADQSIPRSSYDRNQTEHGRMLSSNMLLLNLILLIDVTFSTPMPDCDN